MNKKKVLINVAIIIAVVLLTIYYLVRKEVLNRESLKSFSILVLFLGFAVYLFSVVVYSLCHYSCVKPTMSTFSYKNAFSDLIFGRLGSDITPFRSGHFPLRIYYYLKSGFSFYEGLSAVTKTQIIASFSSVINYGVIFIILTIYPITVNIMKIDVNLNLVVGVGALFHIGSLILAFLLAFVKPFQKLCINLVAKIRYRKNAQQREVFINDQTLKYLVYREQVQSILKKPYIYLISIITYIAYMYLSGSFSYLAYMLTTGQCFVLNEFIKFYLFTICITYISNVIPIPGGNGSSEALFLLVFSSVIVESEIGATLLLWRIISYYLPVMFGALYFVCFAIIKGKRTII